LVLEKVWLSSPHLGTKEKEYVNEAFESNWVAPLGPNVDAFEHQLTQFVGVDEAVSLCSGTAALHLALIACGVKTGDVVLCQSFTFGASAFPITYLNAQPIFIDSEKETWNMDHVLMEKAIDDLLSSGKKPAAIIVVHLYGMPANMKAINEIAGRHGIPVIEDAAEALGSTYFEKKCGSLGIVGVLSFNGNKIITTSGGGALLSEDKEVIKSVRHLSNQAKEPAPFYLHKQVGYNYRLSNISAGIGRGQMEVLEERIQKRREVFERYQNALGHIGGLFFLNEPEGFFSNRWLTTVLFDEKIWPSGTNEKIRLILEAQHIESRPLWKPLHQQPVFENTKCYLNGVSDKLYATGLCLPSGSNLTEDNQKRVIDIIAEALSSS
jgi:dTDP-4-amino-4,6-dideoxygalactose transaminase